MVVVVAVGLDIVGALAVVRCGPDEGCDRAARSAKQPTGRSGGLRNLATRECGLVWRGHWRREAPISSGSYEVDWVLTPIPSGRLTFSIRSIACRNSVRALRVP
jgi:hypothetical protein